MVENAISVTLSTVPLVEGWAYKVLLSVESGPYSDECQIEAKNDIEAISCWLKKHSTNPKTFDAYRREAERLLMWCVYERGLPLIKLKVHDYESYINFLQAPPNAWCTSRAYLRLGRVSKFWRPFVTGLNGTALKMAVRILHSLLNYLVEANYLRANPLKLVQAIEKKSLTSQERQYQVWERMLEEDEWQAIQSTLHNLPEKNNVEIEYKYRIQLLVGLLYFLGLRIHEVVNHSWNAFRYKDEQWWFFVKGKGGKLAHIPVNHQLLLWVKLYRLQLGKSPLPGSDEREPFFVSKSNKAIQIRQLYNWIKTLGKLASKQFENNPLKQKRLRQLSPHWLRHLFASHQDKAGISATIIKANMRHGSIHTTQLYLHAEDNLRHQAVQKIAMQVEHKTPSTRSATKPRFKLNLLIGGIGKSRLATLERVLNSIENNILENYQWQYDEVEKEVFLLKLKQEIALPRIIEVFYRIEALNEAEVSIIQSQIKQECEMRLLTCQFDFKVLP